MTSSTTNPAMTPEKLEAFVHNFLRRDLAIYEEQLKRINDEITEFNQLRNTVSTMEEHLSKGFKTRMNVGGNILMQAKVPDPNKIYIDIGLNIYVEFTLEEATRYIDFKTKILVKHSEVIREESVKTRANIKLALLCIGDAEPGGVST